MSLFPSPTRCRGIPLDTPHTIIISLPTWDDNVELGKGNKILDLLETTYPRFVPHMFVKQVRYILLPKATRSCLLPRLAEQHDTLGFQM